MLGELKPNDEILKKLLFEHFIFTSNCFSERVFLVFKAFFWVFELLYNIEEFEEERIYMKNKAEYTLNDPRIKNIETKWVEQKFKFFF